MTPRSVGVVLADATAEEAQLLLSLLVWPKEAPLPGVVDDYVRRERGAEALEAVSPPKRVRPERAPR
jgi:hypothetical protein